MPSTRNTDAVNLYLIGFMGVGKSAVGRYVARVLGMRFIDSDHAIEETQGMSITEVFAQKGESAFRTLEREFIENGHPARGCVVSCGGGLPCEPGMRERLLAHGVVICLFASEQTILRRTSANNKRPMLAVEDPVKRVRDLMAKRLPIYMNTGTGISTENRDLPEISAHVIRVYRADARLFLQSNHVDSDSRGVKG